MNTENTRTAGMINEIFDVFTWEKSDKIITQDVHHVSGLGNLTHFSRVASRPPTPPHIHSDFLEIHCVVKGRRDTRLYENNNEIKEYTCTGNEAILVFPGEVHSSGPNAQDPCESFALQLNINACEDFLGLNPTYAKLLCDRLTASANRRKHIEPEGLRLLKNAFQLMSSGDIESGTAHIVCFLFEFVSMPGIEEQQRLPIDPRIMSILEHITSNITEPLRLEDLAGLAGYSLSRFKSKFREEVGRTPAAFINASKVEEAKKLLLNTNQPITRIALNLGWSSSNYFCSVFKKLTGISPLQYRKQHGKSSE